MKFARVNIPFLIFVLGFAVRPGHFKTVSPLLKSVCNDFVLVTRDEWNARRSWRDWRMKTPVNHVIIQHTVTPFCHTKFQCIRNIQSMQDYHMDYLSWGDIAYNFMVGGDGRIYEGRGWFHIGTHSINFNYNSIGISYIGNFMEDEPTQEMLNATLNFISCGVEKGYLAPTREIHGHRDVGCTLSPGDKLYAVIRKWNNFKGGIIKNYDCSSSKS